MIMRNRYTNSKLERNQYSKYDASTNASRKGRFDGNGDLKSNDRNRMSALMISASLYPTAGSNCIGTCHVGKVGKVTAVHLV